MILLGDVVYEITVTQKHIYVCFDDLEILVFFSCEIIPPPHHHYSSNKNVIWRREGNEIYSEKISDTF